MKIILTGGTGFLGRLVVTALQDAGHTVTVVTRGTRPLRSEALDHVRGDAARGELPETAFAGRDALINLVGIKCETRTQNFEAAHVAAMHHLVEAAHQHGIRRFIHVSVVVSRPEPREPYHDTKWRAEEFLRASDLDWTVLRPGVIWGPGDDLVSHLVKLIRSAPVFPVVGRGSSLMQPVHGADVAAAIVTALERPASARHTYDLVGPETLALREMVRHVVTATGLRTWIVSTPIWIHRLAVATMSILAAPLATRAQLRMLREGMVGDSDPARVDLDWNPRPFTAESVRPLTDGIPPLLGIALRPGGGPEREALAGCGRQIPRAMALVALAVPLFLLAQTLLDHPWWCVLVWNAALVAGSLTLVRLPWRRLLRPTVGGALRGIIGAVVLYGITWAGLRVLGTVFPELAGQKDIMTSWKDGLAPGVAVVLLTLIVAGEEIFWRGTVNLTVTARWGPLAGIALSALLYAAAHIIVGPPLLWIAALVAGAFWSAMAATSREVFSAFVAHLLWDVTAIFWLPL